MLKNKKILISIVVIILILLLIAGILLFVAPKFKSEESKQEELANNNEDIEKNFSKLFLEVQYDETEEDLITTVYEYEKNVESKYYVNVHFPKINLETCSQINNEIVEIFGRKLLDVISKDEEYTRYTVDYVYNINDTIISLVIRASLKEGNNPQRVIIKTYNYDVSSSSEVTLSKILENRGLDNIAIQKQIMELVRAKNENANVLSGQGYNIYVRDLTSEDYKIENIQDFYISEDGHIYIVFAYGNKNYTETIDVVKI